MRQVFIKWFYEFDAIECGFVKFGEAGATDLIRKAEGAPDAVIVFAMPKGRANREEERGRLLGMAEFERERLQTEDEIDLKQSRPESFKSNGEYRWPEALRATRAWRFLGKPLTKSVLPKGLRSDARRWAYRLSDEDAEKILNLPMVEESVPRGRKPRKSE